MCLEINLKYHTNLKPMIAYKNIIVYKQLMVTKYMSPNTDFVEIIRTEYKTPYKQFPIEFDERGVFSFKKTNLGVNTVRNTVRFVDSALYCVDEGIHAYYYSYPNNYFLDTFYAIIPAGSQYYIGCDGDIVSNQMIIFKNKELMEEYLNKIKEEALPFCEL